MDLTYSLAAFFVGVVVGMTGVGGGALMTPILVLLFGVQPVLAVGTDLWFAAITKTVGGFVHHRRGSVDWEVVRRLYMGSLPAAVLTLAWLHQGRHSQVNSDLILVVLGGVLVLSALAILFKNKTHALGTFLRSRSPTGFKRAQPALTVFAGAVLGLLVTLTSVGGGALGIAMLLFLYPFRLSPASLVGTDVVHAIPLAVIAGAGYLWMGHVDVTLLGTLLVGSVPGIVLGSLLSSRVPGMLLRITIAVVLFGVGAKLLLG